jgi:hypothetical protein
MFVLFCSKQERQQTAAAAVVNEKKKTLKTILATIKVKLFIIIFKTKTFRKILKINQLSCSYPNLQYHSE